MESRISVLKWVLDVDPGATRRVHAAMPAGDPERCGCLDCRNFIAARSHAYPPEARNLFASLGVRYDRESEVGGGIRLAENRYLYYGFFHFVGSIVDGPSSGTKVADIQPSGAVQGGVVQTLQHQPLVGAFGVAFRSKRDLIPEAFGDHPVVQLEFATEVPWCLAEPPET